MKLIRYEEIDQELDGFYNHPASIEESGFIREYDAVVDQLAHDLSAIGSVSVDNDEYGVDVDFSMSKYYKVTRTVIVVATNPSVFSKELVDTIRESLRKCPEKYRIFLDGCFSHGDSFYLFIIENEISGWFRNPQRSGIFET